MILGALAPGDVFFLYDDLNSRRSTHIVQRERDPIPAIITSAPEGGPLSAQAIPTPPIVNIYSPSLSREASLDGVNFKELAEVDLAHQDASESSLEHSSIPLRVVYSPAVSRSGSVTQTDRPSIVLSHHDGSGDDTQIIPTDSSPSTSRARANSYQVRSQPESNVQRRNLSRNNSTDSATRTLSTATEHNAQPPQTIILGSYNRHRRLTIEEVAEEPDAQSTDSRVFKAFPESRWWKGLVVARVALAIVALAVLGNLFYT